MAVELPPFQKLADIPDVAQRHRCAIRGLAITSIVLVSLILILAMPSGMVISYSSSSPLLLMLGIPLMILVVLLVLASNIVSLRNTDKWVPSDVCCNLMRSQPACCTKSCGGNKHCCARLSSVYIASSVFTSLLLVVCVAMLIVGCADPMYYAHYAVDSPRDYNDYDVDYTHYHPEERFACFPRLTERPTSDFSREKVYSEEDYSSYYDLHGEPEFCLLAKTEYKCSSNIQCIWTRDPRETEDDVPEAVLYSERTSHVDVAPTNCPAAMIFEGSSLILLICLVAVTSRSAWLVRAIENGQADIAVLPPNKMVTQLDAGNMMMQRTVVGDAYVVDDKEPETEISTEQNV